MKWMRRKQFLLLLIVLTVLLSGCKREQHSENKKEGTCTLLVECQSVLDNMDRLEQQLKGYIPESGIIFSEQSVAFYSGDTVYDVMKRELEREKIPIEVSFTGKSAYVEGIDNLYEFSCGEQSGWIYSVNGSVSSKSCSENIVKAGDVIRWHFTCNLGEDLK